jgi:hypothetical protein
MLILVKNNLAKLDRFIGDIFYFRFSKFLQPPEQLLEYSIANAELIKEVYPAVFNKKTKVNLYHQSFFVEYMVKVNTPLTIDTSIGWAYWFHIIPYFRSFPYAYYPWKDYLKPTLIWVQLKNILKSRRIINPHLNLIWYGWENYYHFYWDIIPILVFIKKSSYNNLPILVPESSFKNKHVQNFLQLFPDLALNFHLVPNNERLFLKKGCYFVKAARFHPSIIDILKGSNLFNRVSKIRGNGTKKVFLYRPLQGLRSIINNEEVKELLVKLGFKPVDTSQMSLLSQIELFKDVEFCVGVHGAGLNNLIFAKDGFKLIELNASKTYQPDHYKLLSKFKKADYQLFVGGKPQKKLRFSIYLADLKKAIENK